MKEIEIVDDPDKIKIIIEETRSKILRLLRFRDMTISEIASILNKDVSTIYRHIKKLEKAGFVKITGERKTHNVPEKIYGRTAKTILLAPETYEKSDVAKKIAKKRTEIIKTSLEQLGYSIKDFDGMVDMLVYLDELAVHELENLNRDMDWNTLWRLKLILILLKIDRKKLEELRKIIHSPTS